MARIQRYIDVGAMFAEDFGRDNTSLIYQNNSRSIIKSPYGSAAYNGYFKSDEFDSITTEMTLACKLKITSYGNAFNGPHLFSNSDDTLFFRFIDEGGIKLAGSGINVGGSYIKTGVLTGNYPVNEWYNLVIKYDGSDFKLFVNGELEDTFAFVFNINGRIIDHIGSRTGTATYPAGEYMKEMILDNRAWSDEECIAYGLDDVFDYEKNIVAKWNPDSVDTITDTAKKQTPRIVPDGLNDYIDTGIIPDDNTVFEIDADFNAVDSGYHGVYSGSRFFVGVALVDSFRLGYGTFNNTGPTISPNVRGRKLLKIEGGKLYVDGVEYLDGTSGGSISTTEPIYIGGRNFVGTADSFNSDVIYGVKIWQSGTLVRDFVPIKSGQSIYGIVATGNGFFDKVNKVVYTNDGTGQIDYRDGNNGILAGSTGTLSLENTFNGKQGVYNDGTGDKRLQVPYDPSFQFNNESFTVVTMIKLAPIQPSTAGTGKGIVDCAEYQSGGWGIRYINSTDRIYCYIAGDGTNKAISGPTMAEMGGGDEWVTIGFMLDYENSLEKVFLNGEFYDDIAITTGITDSGASIEFGYGQQGGWTYPVEGGISTTVVLDKKLTDLEMKDLHNKIFRGEI